MDNTDIDVSDVNSDTIDDLVVAMSLNGSKTVIVIGSGDGTFRVPSFIQEPNLRVPQYQAVADYNGDGRLDLALTLGWGSEGLMEVRNGNGDGTFGPLTLYLAPPPLSSIGGLKIVAADFNADGKPDLALGWGGASNGLAVLRNTTGTVPAPRPSTPSLLSPADGAIVMQPVIIDWSDVTQAVSYEVQVDDSSTFAAPFVANFSATQSRATLSGLPAQRLWWRVRARNSDGVFGSFSTARRFTPQATPAAAALSAITVNPAAVTGGTGSTATVTLTAAAPSGGATISLASSNTAAARVPSSVAVAAGATNATVTVTTSAVSTQTAASLSATYNGVTRTASLTINPPGQTVTLTVIASGRGGERVTSSPSGISVSTGSSGSAGFASGTRVTLSVTNGRDAIWSGACSSGGAKLKTSRQTVTGAATVQANVQ